MPVTGPRWYRTVVLILYLASCIYLIQRVLSASLDIYICLYRLDTFLFPADPASPYTPRVSLLFTSWVL